MAISRRIISVIKKVLIKCHYVCHRQSEELKDTLINYYYALFVKAKGVATNTLQEVVALSFPISPRGLNFRDCLTLLSKITI